MKFKRLDERQGKSKAGVEEDLSHRILRKQKEIPR